MYMKQILPVAMLLMLSGLTASAAVSLTNAVKQVARKYCVSISYSPTLTDRAAVNNVPDNMASADECLTALLADTDFCLKKISDGSYCLWLSKEKAALRLERERKARELEQATRQRIEEYRRRRKEISAAPRGTLLLPVQAATGAVPAIVAVPPATTCSSVPRQRFSLKTNALLWATTSPNAAFEAAIGSHFSVELPVSFNLWSLAGSRLHHASVFPAFKYWLGGEVFADDYIGAYVGYAYYDIGNISLLDGNLEDFYYDGNLYSAGVLYGHRFSLSRHFALEAEIGMGYVYVKYAQTPVLGAMPGKEHEKHKWSLTRLAVNACYTF